MNDADYAERINQAEDSAKALKTEVTALLAYAIEARSAAEGEDKTVFRRDTVRLDKARKAINDVIGHFGRID